MVAAVIKLDDALMGVDRLGFDTALAASALECGRDLCARHSSGSRRGWSSFEKFAGLGAAQAVCPGGESIQGSGLVLAQQ